MRTLSIHRPALKLRPFLAALLPCALLAGPILADRSASPDPSAPFHIEDTVVVTATKTDAKIQTLGNEVSVLTREDIDRAHPQTLGDALAMLPGVQVLTNGPRGANTSLFIRGAKTEHVLVLVDGVVVNDPMGLGRGFDFSTISLDAVERIELVRGPQSTLYGSDAMSGVVNIITRTGEGKPGVTLGFEAGKHKTFKGSVESAGAVKDMKYAVGLVRQTTQGFSAAGEREGNTERDGFQDTTAHAKFSWVLGDGFEAEVAALQSHSRNELDQGAGAGADDPNYSGKQKMMALRGEVRYSNKSKTYIQKLSISYHDVERDYTDLTDTLHPFDSSSASYKGIERKVEWQHTVFPLPHHILTAGYEYSREQGHSLFDSQSAYGHSLSEFPNKGADTHSIYLQDQFDMGGRLFVTAGGRVDRHDRFGTEATFRVAPSWLIASTGTRLRFSAGSAFKAPSLYQLYSPATAWGPVGNETLLPEKSWAVDGALEQQFLKKTLWVSFGGFFSRYKNLIEFLQGYQNVGRATTKGMEFAFQWEPDRHFRTSGSYTYAIARNDLTHENLVRRPRHSASLGLDVKPSDKVRFGAEIRHLGERDDQAWINWVAVKERMGGRTVCNLTFSQEIAKDVEFYGRLDNLFDNKTEEIYGYTPQRFAAYAGIRWTIR